MPGPDIRTAVVGDASSIAEIYNHYIEHTVVTFEEEPVTAEAMARRLEDVTLAGLPWLVAGEAGAVDGYAYAGPWRARSAYRFSVEVTVYLAPGSLGRGLGSFLYSRIIDELRNRGIHTALGGIALPNAASVALHEKFGFRKVAHLAEVGWKFDRWIDVGYWQLAL